MLIITDLDGCLLDAVTYAWEPAREALDALRARSVPVIPCTSKTRAETARIQAELGIPGAAIVEDGGAIVAADGSVEILGRPYADLRRVLEGLRAETGGALREDITAAGHLDRPVVVELRRERRGEHDGQPRAQPRSHR